MAAVYTKKVVSERTRPRRDQDTVQAGGSRLLQPKQSRECRNATADLLSPPLFACVTRPTRLAALHLGMLYGLRPGGCGIGSLAAKEDLMFTLPQRAGCNLQSRVVIVCSLNAPPWRVSIGTRNQSSDREEGRALSTDRGKDSR
jgi:hypothetical protein